MRNIAWAFLVLFLNFMCGSASAVTLTQCGTNPDIKPGQACYVSTALFCSATADYCNDVKPGGRTLVPTGKTCSDTGTSCDAACWTGYKHICMAVGPEYEVDTARTQQFFEEVFNFKDSDGTSVDILTLARGADDFAKSNLHFYDAEWWNSYQDPSPVITGCQSCVEGLGLLADVVGSVGWAVEGLGPFISAGTSVFRFFNEKLFGPGYLTAIKQVGQADSGMVASIKEASLQNEIAKAMNSASSANAYIKQHYNSEFDIASEGESIKGLMSSLTDGSSMGINQLFADQNFLATADLAAPKNMAVPAPSRMYALGAWIYSADTYLLVNRMAAVINAYPAKCFANDASARKDCVLENSEKTLEQLLRESWVKDNQFISNIVINILDSDSGFIVRAKDYEKAVQAGISKRMRMIKFSDSPVAYGTCTTIRSGSSMPAVSQRRFAGYVVTDEGIGDDYGISSLLNLGGLRIDANIQGESCMSGPDIQLRGIINLSPMVIHRSDPTAADRSEALRDGRLWASWVAARYSIAWGVDYLPVLRKHIDSWTTLAKTFCKTIPVESRTPAAQQCSSLNK